MKKPDDECCSIECAIEHHGNVSSAGAAQALVVDQEPLRQYQNKEIYDRVLPNIGFIISKLGIIRDFPVRFGAQSPTVSTNDKEKSSILIKIAWLRSGGRAVSSHLQDCEHRDIVTLWAL